MLSTNIDNALVGVAMVASAPPEKAKRIAYGQARIRGHRHRGRSHRHALFDVPTRAIGLLGLVPLVLGIRGLMALRHAEGRERVARRAFGSGFFAAALVTLGAGGDNLAVYIPLFRVAGGVGRGGHGLRVLGGRGPFDGVDPQRRAAPSHPGRLHSHSG